jgi:hypothetical protein
VGEGPALQAKLRYLALAAFFPKAEARKILQCSIRNVASRDNHCNAQKAVQLSAVLSRIFPEKAFTILKCYFNKWVKALAGRRNSRGSLNTLQLWMRFRVLTSGEDVALC